jgi:hypothetical protein
MVSQEEEEFWAQFALLADLNENVQDLVTQVGQQQEGLLDFIDEKLLQLLPKDLVGNVDPSTLFGMLNTILLSVLYSPLKVP